MENQWTKPRRMMTIEMNILSMLTKSASWDLHNKTSSCTESPHQEKSGLYQVAQANEIESLLLYIWKLWWCGKRSTLPSNTIPGRLMKVIQRRRKNHAKRLKITIAIIDHCQSPRLRSTKFNKMTKYKNTLHAFVSKHVFTRILYSWCPLLHAHTLT